MRVDGMRNEMEESIAEKSTGSEAEKDFKEGVVLLRVVQRNEPQNDHGCGADQTCCNDGAKPHRIDKSISF